MWLYIALLAAALLVYYKILQPQKHWQEKGVKYLKSWPLIGNMSSMIFRRKSFAEWSQDMYYAFPNERYFGIFQFLHPTLIIRDPELIKEIGVKSADVFPEHQQFAPEGIDPIWDRNLLTMKGGKKWHDMRSTLSPSFTSSKMKMFFGLIKVCGKQFTDYFQAKDELVVVEMKDVFGKFTGDVIGTTAFGITSDSLKNPENEFYATGKLAADFSGLRSLLFFLYGLSPTLMELFKVRIIQAKVSSFFTSVIKETIKVRTENKVIRPDMIHLLLEARKNRSMREEIGLADSSTTKTSKEQKTEIADEDIVAQAFIFFFAGYETVSTLMSFTSYELALNPDVQNKLRNEIDDAFETCNGDITYEVLMGMKYLDMVISESLRKWPPAEVTDRHSVSSFRIERELQGENIVHLDPNTNVWIPIYALHRDPQYYPDPDTFDPERFNDENKNNIKPFTYLPFGVGPRICIGSRFALMETKLLFALILSKFEIIPVEKTQIPLRLGPGTVNMATEKGIWLGFKPRHN